MPYTHKKKIKRNENDTSSKFKQKKRNVKSLMNKIMGGFLTSEVHGATVIPEVHEATVSSLELSPSQYPGYVKPSMMNPVVFNGSDISQNNDNGYITVNGSENKVPHLTNTSFRQSELKSNPFYSKKSTHVVENKQMYSFNTNYILDEIEKLQSQSGDPKFMVTPEMISEILANKPAESITSEDKKEQTQKQQQKLHRDLCDFD
jgi:hypothetical protein